LNIRHIDTACVAFELSGVRFLTDPCFDQPGRLYHYGFGAVSRKTGTAAAKKEDISVPDIVLLSHHQHGDNLDRSGEEFLKTCPLGFSTTSAARKFSNLRGLRPWESVELEIKGKQLRVTGIPARHRPIWLPEFFSGKVLGFVLELEGKTIYITGDTVYFKALGELSRRFGPIDLVIPHMGSVEFHYLTAWARYTMDSKQAVRLLNEIKPDYAFPIHFQGWTHFKETEEKIRGNFAALAPGIQLTWPRSGETQTLEI